jgi:hypothetical protein
LLLAGLGLQADEKGDVDHGIISPLCGPAGPDGDTLGARALRHHGQDRQ